MFLLGYRSEPHLEHAAWGCMAASQSYILNPELSAPHLLGPGATLTEAVLLDLKNNAPILAEKRHKGVFETIGEWALDGVVEVRRILKSRETQAKVEAIRSVSRPSPSDGLFGDRERPGY
jgi:hypothetical protein